MDQNDKISNDKITRLESEIKVLKNEVQAVLLDLRESYLNMENPFNRVADPATIQPIVITERTSPSRPQPEQAEPEFHKPEPATSEARPHQETPEQTIPESGLTHKDTQPVSTRNPGLGSQAVSLNEIPTRATAKLDILTVAALVSWAGESTRKLGREKTALVLDISQAMGYLSEDMRLIVAKIVELAPEQPNETSANTKSFLESLMKLNRLVGQDSLDEIALQILSTESGDTQRG
jgi:hypothetical protein